MILKQKISNELSACDIKINTSITMKIIKIKNEINTKIGDKLSTHDTKVTNELTTYLSKIISSFIVEFGNVFRFVSFNANINNLQKKINQIYADTQSVDFDQYSVFNKFEALNRSCESSNSTNSSSSSSNLPLEENRNRFKRSSNESEALNRSCNSTPSFSLFNSSLDENRNHFKRVFDLKRKWKRLMIMCLKL